MELQLWGHGGRKRRQVPSALPPNPSPDLLTGRRCSNRVRKRPLCFTDTEQAGGREVESCADDSGRRVAPWPSHLLARTDEIRQDRRR